MEWEHHTNFFSKNKIKQKYDVFPIHPERHHINYEFDIYTKMIIYS